MQILVFFTNTGKEFKLFIKIIFFLYTKTLKRSIFIVKFLSDNFLYFLYFIFYFSVVEKHSSMDNKFTSV